MTFITKRTYILPLSCLRGDKKIGYSKEKSAKLYTKQVKEKNFTTILSFKI